MTALIGRSTVATGDFPNGVRLVPLKPTTRSHGPDLKSEMLAAYNEAVRLSNKGFPDEGWELFCDFFNRHPQIKH